MHRDAQSRSVGAAPASGRWLLIRGKSGDLPAALQGVIAVTKPLEVVQVVGFNNALWRLGHERFDTVLLDFDRVERTAIAFCRQEIAKVAAVPVIDLHDEEDLASCRRPRASRAGVTPHADHGPVRAKPMRLPWQRRPRRPSEPTPRGVTPVG